MSGITPRRSIESLRKEAKRWLKALRAGDATARGRLANVLPQAPLEPTLRDLQHALALEHGFPGWTSLRDATSGRPPAPHDIDWVARFFDVACPDHHVRGGPDHVRAMHTAMRILEHFPHVATDSVYTAIVTGNLAKSSASSPCTRTSRERKTVRRRAIARMSAAKATGFTTSVRKDGSRCSTWHLPASRSRRPTTTP